ncbi:restriction endonuclease [Sedimentisphaera salicampi]|uniref:EcoKMrr n=1 Tax=Sedimentisphaera salicampi TaxID=1941349 RepID=A0A1W6LNC2_9BACT|nr:restriction endonuclease [Sedimentisphaera salicampi]ARN57246.1 EcoKMrr [Sedimentisphaera salicampi]
MEEKVDVPNFFKFMLPMLEFIKDGNCYNMVDIYNILAEKLDLSESQKKVFLPSGQQEVYKSRIGWAKTYLKKAGLIKQAKRGQIQITENGLKTLNEGLTSIDLNYLKKFPSFNDFRNSNRKLNHYTKTTKGNNRDSVTPEEQLEICFEQINNTLSQELLSSLYESSPDLFEKIVIDLLLKMGYGGSRRDAGKAIGKSGDEGIDGYIKEDKLGLDIIYVQAKKWDTSKTIGRPEIQKFAGALQGQKAQKGIFIATAKFSNEAIDYAKKINSSIILIDGKNLANYMIETGVGVSVSNVYEIKEMDYDYFSAN